MDFSGQLRVLSDKITRLKDQIHTEEATKTAFVLPFLSILGYDVFDPMEVIPEFTADLGIKKGEKVDYCICKDGHPIIIVECKPWTEALNPHNSQLFRYFHVTATRFSLLTNGIIYRFYTDLEEANKMDEKPFLELNLLDLKDHLIPQLKKFEKASFSVDEILNTASELKYSREIRSLLASQLIEPSENFVKFFVSQVYEGRVNQKISDQFKILVRSTFQQFISDSITDKFKTALNNEVVKIEEIAVSATPKQESIEVSNESKVITTPEEMEAYYIVKSILRSTVKSSRINYRDNQNYFSVIMDDNNRKPICRIYLNSGKKYIGLFDVEKKETKSLIESIEDIYQYQSTLLEAAAYYPE